MSVPGPLPGGGVRLPPNYYDLPPLEPKHKAIIIYLSYFARVATFGNTIDDETNALVMLWQFATSVFMKEVYNVKIHPDSIQRYCDQARANAEKAGLRWDHFAVAKIISSQVRDHETFDEVTSFLSKIEGHFSLSAHFFRDQVFKATRGDDGNSIAYTKLEAFWEGAVSSKSCDPPRILDPVLRQSSNNGPKTANNYGFLCYFENLVAEGKPFEDRFPKAMPFILDD